MTGIKSRIKIAVSAQLFLVLGVLAFFLTEASGQVKPREDVDVGGGVPKPAVSYTAETLRDPFVNPIQTEIAVQPGEPDTSVPDAPLPAMKVQGIFWGGKFPQAIVNDKIVKVGEKIEGAQVVAIEKDSVTVFFGSKQFVLTSPATDNLAASTGKNDAKKGGN